ncbi:MAG: corrinoid protein [Capsulimonadaceae bacterium]
MDEYQELYTAIVDGDAATAKALASRAVADNTHPQRLLDNYMIPAMDEVGRLFETGEIFVPELLISARAMKAALGILRPKLAATDAKLAATVVIGTVHGDLHDIGKNLVAAMLEGGGFEVVDLGVDVTAQRFIDAARERNARIICLSALLTTTMPSMRKTVEAVHEAGLDAAVKVMVGGAPITQGYADEIGADGFSDNASGAVRIARKMVGV